MNNHPLPLAALENHIAILGKTGSGKTFTAKGIAETLLSQGKRVCIIDPTGAWWGLRSGADGKKDGFPVVIFGGIKADAPLSAEHGEAIAQIVGTSNTPAILDTRLLSVSERTRFFADFAEALLRRNQGPLHLIIDEAHLFAPQGRARCCTQPITWSASAAASTSRSFSSPSQAAQGQPDAGGKPHRHAPDSSHFNGAGCLEKSLGKSATVNS